MSTSPHPPSPSPSPVPPAPGRLERPVDDRKVAGVCAAIARHFRIDPLIVRILAVVLTLFGGIGLIAYFAGLMLIPAEGSDEPLIREGINGPERTKVLVLGAAATIALLGLPEDPLNIFSVPGSATIAILAVAAVWLLVLRREPVAADAPTTVVTGDAATVRPARRPGRGAAILGGALLAFAATGGILAALGGDVRWDIALCSAVIAIGVLLVVTAPLGGARILVPFGVILALLAGGAAAADLNLRGGVGDHLEHPAALASGTTAYHLAAGRLMVDLRDADLPAGVTKVDADIGFGQIVVRVPEGVRVELHGHASAGDVEIFGRDDNGLDARRTEVLPGTDPGRVLRVDAHAGFGQVRVVDARHALPPLGDHATTAGLPEAAR
ncbi:MAG: phage shock protein PspC [Solirubrobacterales bacterium]|nr:phage shock protein PspC [Solirubrobacterales bacterium]